MRRITLALAAFAAVLIAALDTPLADAQATTEQWTLTWDAPTQWADTNDPITTPLTYTVYARLCGASAWTALADATGISVRQSVRTVDAQCHEYAVTASTVEGGMTYTSDMSTSFTINWGASSSSSSSSAAPHTKLGVPANLAGKRTV